MTRLIEVKNREQVLWGGWLVSPGEMMGMAVELGKMD